MKISLKVIINFLYTSVVLCNVVGAQPYHGDDIRLARENEFPFVAAITKRTETVDPNRDTICTASLITDKDILTAEHCLNGRLLNGTQVIVGSIDILSRSIYYPAWWIPYIQWAYSKNVKNGYNTNDVCILRLTSKVADGIVPAKISYLSYKNLKEKDVVTMGWGKVKDGSFPRILRTTDMKIMRNSDCEKRVFSVGQEELIVDKNLLCTIRVPYALMMNGDSGGPLLYQNKIVAISRGTCPLPARQFHPDKVNLYTILKYYKDFIRETLRLE